ncbi:hypothetical protein I541_1763 [Mycobacteroides abscessus]|nr:hypothetical protein I541_1763 [Mycobacteroides abscessus]
MPYLGQGVDDAVDRFFIPGTSDDERMTKSSGVSVIWR